MYLIIFPATPSQSLTGAVLGAGYQPVPVSDVAEAGQKEPESGWGGAIVELGADPSLGITVASKLREEYDVPVLIVVDRTLTGDLDDKDGFDDFILTPVTSRNSRCGSPGSTSSGRPRPTTLFSGSEISNSIRTRIKQRSEGHRPP